MAIHKKSALAEDAKFLRTSLLNYPQSAVKISSVLKTFQKTTALCYNLSQFVIERKTK